MKYSRVFVLICLPLLMINLLAIIYNSYWLSHLSETLLFVPLVIGFKKQLDFSNFNLVGFISLTFLSSLLGFLNGLESLHYISLFLFMTAYFFLIREALKFTRRETANKFMLFFFFLLISANAYFVFKHLQELEEYLAGIIEFGFYSIYYINLLVLSIVALIYYLNSYSRKSVLFITLVMAFVVSDILRDMAFFYLPDTSVLLMRSILLFGGIILAFQFFTTKEKKLRLINLV